MAEDAYCPDWYGYLVIAERLNCRPWELASIPSFWTDVAAVANQAEGEAREAIERQRNATR